MFSTRFRTAVTTLAFVSIAFTASCKKDGAGGSGGASAKEAFAYLPKDTTMVVGVNMNAAMNAKVLEKYRDQMTKNLPENLAELKEACGWDLTKDLKSAVVGISGDPNRPSTAVAVVSGSISKAKLAECAKARAEKDPNQSLTMKDEGKVTALTTGKGTRYAYWPNDSTMVVDMVSTTPERLTALIAGGESVSNNEATMAVVKRANKGATFWVAGRTPNLPPMVAMSVGKFETFAVSVTADSGVNANIKMFTGSEDAAKKAKQGLMGIMAMGKAQPQAKELIEKVSVDTEGDAVVIGMKLSAADIEKIAGMTGMGR